MTGAVESGIHKSGAAGPEPSLAEVLARLGALEAALTNAVERLPGLEAVARVVETLEQLPQALAVQMAATYALPAKPAEEPYLKLAEAAKRGKVSVCFLQRMIRQGRLRAVGKERAYRIETVLFDQQMALGWPVLDMPDPVAAMRGARAARGVRVPRPKRPAMFNNPSPKLV
jgi:hypothetical protein